MIPWEPLPPELEPLENFTAYILRELGLVEPDGGPTKQQLGILDWMGTGPDRQITVGFRGIAKSTMAAIVASHRLRLDPIEEKILIPSNTTEKAMEITTQMLNWFKTIDILQCLAPLPDGRSSARAFDVGPVIPGRDQAPSVRACGILSSSLTGKRCTCAIPDDIETLNNSITPLKQERLAHAVTELEQIILPEAGQLLPRRILFLGTPHLETSLYLKLCRERGYKIRFWPARYPDPKKEAEIGCYEGGLDPLMLQEVLADPSLVGAPTDPERFGHEELLKRELGNTRTSWQLNYMLNTRLSTLDKYPIRLGDLIVLGLDGKALPETISWGNAAEMRYQELVCTGMGADRWYYRPAFVGHWIAREDEWRCILAIDPSGRGQDEMAWAVVAELNGNLFVLEVGGTRMGYSDEALKQLALVAKRWRVNLVVTEPNFGDGMFDNLLAPVLQAIYPVGIEPAPRSAVLKDRRIVDVLAPLIQQHRMVFSKELLASDYLEAEMDSETGHQRSLAFQLSRITGDRGSLKFYDRIDALSIAAAWYVESVAQDQGRQARARQDELDQAVLDCYFDTSNASADAMAMGIMPTRRGRVAGGIDRPQIRGR